jgi:hypothetical protein
MQGGQVDDLVTDRNAATPGLRAAKPTEYAERKILQRKIAACSIG